MIARSLRYAALFLIGYQLFLTAIKPKWSRPLEFAQGNRTKAQQFLYAPQTPRVVLVGSSLLFRLEKHMQRPDLTVLAFVGQGSVDGLEVVDRSERRPDLLLIETNRMYRLPRRDFLDDLFQPGLLQLRGLLPAMQQEYQPANLLIPPLEKAREQLLGSQPEQSSLGSMSPDEIRKLGIRRALDEQARAVPPPRWLLPMLRQRCDRIAARGTQIRFFQIPEEKEVMNSAPGIQLRTLINEQIPGFSTVPPPPGTDYQTLDGEHLNDASAANYGRYLLQETEDH